MKIVFLGRSTEEKRFLLLCLAKVASVNTKVTILTKYPYGFDNTNTVYEYCGIEIVVYIDEKDFMAIIPEGETVFLDVEDVFSLSEDYRVITICEPIRKTLEFTVKQTVEYTLLNPSCKVSVIYLNILEYSKADKEYLNFLWEQGLPNIVNITFSHAIYFESINHAIMIDSQYSNSLQIKEFSFSFKSVIKGIIQDVFTLDLKTARDMFKKAERTK